MNLNKQLIDKADNFIKSDLSNQYEPAYVMIKALRDALLGCDRARLALADSNRAMSLVITELSPSPADK